MADFSQVLVVMALRDESAGVFEGADVPVLYCGVGKLNASMELMRELCRYESADQAAPLVLNFGSAGSRVHPAGTLAACHEFVQRDMDVTGLGFSLGSTPFDEAPAALRFEPVFSGLPTAICGSGDSFSMAVERVACDVVDMEAYALAKVCWRMKAPFACVKYVTDGADQSAAADWQSNLHKAAAEFLNLYLSVRTDD